MTSPAERTHKAARLYRAGRKRILDALRDDTGLTLVELLVVLAILGLVAALVAPRAIELLSKAKTDTARIQLGRLASVLDLYSLEVGDYPPEQPGLRALIEKPPGEERWSGPYIREADGLVDPWGQPYEYRFPGQHGPYDLFSLGADGLQGGEGDDSDVTNWSN